ncbi:uncharacterized protein LOC123550702 isoform X2 [Mercenaria mercenaria]|nr:uncharacterized protein LOC123550702 isoform X2 [Mercenaria mercenaria]
MWSKKYKRFGKVVEVVDTPGIFDTDSDHSAVQKELLKALALSTPGFHVIAFVLMRGRFTEEIQKTQDLFFQWFGPGVEKYACVILTDTSSEDTKRKYIYDDPHEKLAELVRTCNDNVVPLNNVTSDDGLKDRQIRRLFEVIENIKQTNGNQHFSNVAFQLAEAYIMSKCPRELTQESIMILQNAGLSMKISDDQCKYLDQVFTLSVETGEESTNEGDQYNVGLAVDMQDKIPASVVVVNEQKDICGSGSVGNLPIFDSSSNERICNTQRSQQHLRQKVEISNSNIPPSSETQTSEERLDSFSQTFEVPGRLDDQSNSNISQDFVHAKQYQDQSGDYSDKMQASASDQSEEQIHRGKHKASSRRNRKIDIESVHYETPGQPIDDFKNKVNKGENGDEELHGLSGFFKKAWKFCKRKLSSCTLL